MGCSSTGPFGDDDDREPTGDAIYGFEEVVATAAKMLKIAKVRSSTATVTGSINPPPGSDRYLMSPSLYLNNIRKVC